MEGFDPSNSKDGVAPSLGTTSKKNEVVLPEVKKEDKPKEKPKELSYIAVSSFRDIDDYTKVYSEGDKVEFSELRLALGLIKEA